MNPEPPLENDAMSEANVLQEAGSWYVNMMDVTQRALEAVNLPGAAAPSLIAALAREGYSIEKLDD